MHQIYRKQFIYGILFLVLLGLVIFWSRQMSPSLKSVDTKDRVNQSLESSIQTAVKMGNMVEPIDHFAKRVTQKPFGIYVNPKNSPTEHEKFTGYHTGVDAEIYPNELEKNIFVRSVADGVVRFASAASGYGGVVAIEHTIEGKKIFAIYGHLRISSVVLKIGDGIKARDVIGVLGDDKSLETDGERKHLHFGLYKGKELDIRGYVLKQDDLQYWINPLQFF